jgi:hypothetical protein
LFSDTCEPSHLLFPEVDLILRSSILVVSGAGLGLIESILDLSRPLLKESLEAVNHGIDFITLSVTTFKELLDLWLIFLRVSFQLDVAVDGFQSLSELVGELVKDGGELLLAVLLTEFPILLGETIDHGLEALVDGGVQGCDGMF